MHIFLINIIKNQKGTTLLEAIITIAVLGIIVVPIGNIFSNCLLSTIGASEQIHVNQLASSKLEEIKSAPLGTFEIGTVQYENVGEYKISSLISKVDGDNKDPYKINESVKEKIHAINDFIIELDAINNEAYIKYEEKDQSQSTINITASMFTLPRYEWFIQYMFKDNYTNNHKVEIGYIYNNTKKVCTSFNINGKKLNSQFKIIVKGVLPENICVNYKVYNLTKKPIKAIVAGSKTGLYNNIKIECMDGTTTAYYNMSKDDSYAWVYNVSVSVSKQSEQLVVINGTKKGR